MAISSRTRLRLYKDLLSTSKFFKLVCGAGLEDNVEVEYLTYVYTIAGCSAFDVSANPIIVESARRGIKAAMNKSTELGIHIPFEPFLIVSVGMPGDHHVRKASINQNCIECNLCIPTCPTNAIPADLNIIKELCIGCGNCEAACPPSVKAITYSHNEKKLLDVLPKCVQAGAESIELHASVPDNESTLKEWSLISKLLPNGMISICLDRRHLSNVALIKRIKAAKEVAGERLIVQADGNPMGGGTDDFNTTLQSIAIADLINKELKLKDRTFSKLPLLISGGTNSFTGQLAKQCGVPFNGITIGTHARKIVSHYKDSIDKVKEDNLLEAIASAKELITKTINI